MDTAGGGDKEEEQGAAYRVLAVSLEKHESGDMEAAGAGAAAGRWERVGL